MGPPPPRGDERVPGPPPPPAVTPATESRSTAAAWLAGLGVLLLLAAAGTFLAVSWERLDLPARIAIVGAGTGSAILAGHRLRPRLPAVGGAVFHLGALLVPVDALALAIHLDVAAGGRWLAVGLTAVATLPLLAAAGRSRTLAWAALTGIPVAATGLGVLGAAHAPVVVVAVAVLLAVLQEMTATAVSERDLRRLGPVLAGAAPALALTAAVVPLLAAGAGMLATGYGRTVAATWTGAPWWALMGVGIVAGALLLALGARSGRPTVGALAPVATLSAVVAMWLPGDAPRLAELLALPVLALLVEVAAIGLAADRVLGAPTRLAARVCELTAAVLTGPVVVVLVVLPDLAGRDAEVAAMLATLAVVWVAAAVRAVAPFGSGVPSTVEPVLRRLYAAAAVATGAVSLQFVAAAPVVPALVLALGAMTLAVPLLRPDMPAGVAIQAIAVSSLAVAGAVQGGYLELLVPGLLGLVAVSAAAFVASRREDVAVTVLLGLVAAGLSILVPLAAGDLAAAWLRPALLLAVSFAVAANPVVALTLRLGAALTLPFAVAATGAALDLGAPERGLLLAAVAAVAAFAAVATSGPWRPPLALTAAAHGAGAWVLVADEPLARAVATLVLGLAVAGEGWRSRRPLLAHAGGAVAVLGSWDLLAQQRVEAIDLWLAPVALHLLVAGGAARRRGASSWVAYVPGLLLLAVPALAERLHGGPGWHAAIAVGAATLAVVAGGTRRLGGPLVAGSVLLVAAMLVEVFAVIAAVPTWAWLALTGALLVGVAVLIERHGGSPAVTARRLIDVVNDRFA